MEKHQAAMKVMQEKSGANFDRAYINYEIEMHTRLVALVDKAARTTNHVALKRTYIKPNQGCRIT
jgi:predicted outer membrane protein